MKKKSPLLFLTILLFMNMHLIAQTASEIPCGTDYLRALNDSDSQSKTNFDSVRTILWNQLKNGVYFYSVIINKVVAANGKFVIIK